MARLVAALLLAAMLLLSGCGRLLRSEGQPIPGPTPSGTPTGTGTPVAGESGGGDDGAPADDAVTDGPDVTG